MADNAKVRYVLGGIYLVSFVLFMVAFCSPWWTYPDSTFNRTFGLWSVCRRTDNGDWACFALNLYVEFQKKVPEAISPYMATQAMMCLSLIVHLLTIFLFAQWIFNLTERFTLKRWMPVTAGMIAGVFSGIGVSVYIRILAFFIGWSCSLASASGGINIVTGIITLLYFKYCSGGSEYAPIEGSTNA